MNDPQITAAQLEQMLIQARLETYAAFAISLLPIVVLITLICHAFNLKRTTTIGFIIIGIITFTIPSPIMRALGFSVAAIALLVFVIQWISGPNKVTEKV